MARLNEAPCASESVDALKRRFIRQNRELAKANSTQSVRIRCLEAEISRLLTDNLNLRDEILQLRNDLAGTSTKRTFGGVQAQLQAQVDVLAKLIAGIGVPKETNKALSPEKRRYPTVGWGRGQGDPLDGTDGRLPAIREDKSYPRRTLDQQDTQTNSESPVIGSPPVSHFQDEDPIKYDVPITTEVKKENEDASLPANLETRRKKRESSTKLSIRRMSVFSSPEEEAKDNTNTEPEKLATQVLPIRAGAKRKLGSRDDDVKSTTDFTFSRKASGTSDSNDESSAKEEKVREPVKAFSRRDSVRPAVKLAERKALGEKSINTDPVMSPKKTTKGASGKEEKEILKKAVKAVEEPVKPRSIRDRRSRVPVDDCITIVPSQDHTNQAPKTVEISPPETEAENEAKPDLPPKTPFAAADILSAPSTECSEPATGRYTPPPGDFGASTDANGRPGRRARAQVNYAEPSLTAKMRRPTKELLDAVGKDGRPQKGMIVRKDANGIEIKVEEGAGSAWKEMPSVSTASRGLKTEEPGSPLSKKSEVPEALKVMHAAEPEPILPSAASQAIAALIKDSKTSAAAAAARRRSAGGRNTEAETAIDRRGSSIYDFASSSPPRSTKPASSSSSSSSSSRPTSRSSDRDADENVSGRPGSRGSSSRRHSSVPNLAMPVAKVDGARGASRFGSGAIASHKRAASSSIGEVAVSSSAPTTAGTAEKVDLRASRRRSMML